MRIDMDDRLDKEYPERSECQINERNCTYRVDKVCHQCGVVMCDSCSVSVRHQPQFSTYSYEGQDGVESVQQHCPRCLQMHTLNRRNVGLSLGGVVLGVALVAAGNTETVALTVVGLLLLLVGLLLGRYEYRLKARDNDNYGLASMW